MIAPRPPSAGVIGWPIAHSKSTIIHRLWLQKVGIDGDYGRFPVSPWDLEQAIEALPRLGLTGVNVTAPHKEAVFRMNLSAGPAVVEAGAINTVKVIYHDDSAPDLMGFNTDIGGFLEPLKARSFTPCSAVIIGIGGAARAAVAGLLSVPIQTLTIVSRSPDRARETLATMLRERRERHETAIGWSTYPNYRPPPLLEPELRVLELGETIPRADLIINATPLGMVGHPPLRLELSKASERAIAFDVVYTPVDTVFLSLARAAGMETIDGLAMLIEQAAQAFEILFEHAAPRECDAELRELLTS